MKHQKIKVKLLYNFKKSISQNKKITMQFKTILIYNYNFINFSQLNKND